MNNVKVNMDNLDEQERQQLLALIEKANSTEEKPWKPRIGQKYWFVCVDGAISYFIYDGCNYDRNCVDFGSAFRTKEEAEFERECRLVMKQLRELAGGCKPPTKECGWWYIVYDNNEDKINITRCFSFIYSTIAFKTDADARKAIDAIGEERLKKYYFMI